jgi:hypothetical protein
LQEMTTTTPNGQLARSSTNEMQSVLNSIAEPEIPKFPNNDDVNKNASVNHNQSVTVDKSKMMLAENSATKLTNH